MTGHALILALLTVLLWCPCVLPVRSVKPSSSTPRRRQQTRRPSDDAECSSLSGPFCTLTNSMAFFEPYMTPISLLDLQQEGGEVSRRPINSDDGVAHWQRKKCFFQHYSASWMDAGGDANDILSQPVASVDECEQLCCDHARCNSFTFWRGRTCFLRASTKAPRHDADSFTGIRLI